MLSARGVKLLLDLFGQFDGRNNGDLTAAWSIMSKRGWRSKETLYRALGELLDRRWIVTTRQGGRRICSLYGVTWLAINECGRKIDVSATRTPSGAWKINPLAR